MTAFAPIPRPSAGRTPRTEKWLADTMAARAGAGSAPLQTRRVTL